jgi:hypothetical protein
MLLLYAFILFIIIYFEKLKPFFLKMAFICLITLMLISAVNTINNKTQQKLVVYSVENGIAVDFISGNNVLFIADSNISKNQMLIDNITKNNRRFHGINNVTTLGLNQLNSTDTLLYNTAFVFKNFVGFGNNKMTFINRKSKYFNTEKQFSADFIIITGLPSKKSDAISSVFNSNQIVLTKNLRHYELKEIYRQFEKDKNKLFDINNSGAFSINF